MEGTGGVQIKIMDGRPIKDGSMDEGQERMDRRMKAKMMGLKNN